MKVIYQEINKSFQALSEIFFLKNQNLWFFFSPYQKSRYFGGFLFFDNQAFRFLDDINFNETILESCILNSQEIIFYFKNNQAYLKLNQDSLEITFTSWQNLNLTFDFKDIFKNEAEKRKIEIRKISSHCLIVEEILENNYTVKILIEADSPLDFQQKWIFKKMDFDIKRNSPPYEWRVFDGIFGKIKKLKIKILTPIIRTKIETPVFKTQENTFLNFLISRIQTLILNNYLPAGFPWFYENWFRDELLSLYLLKDVLRNDFLKERLKYYLTNLENSWYLNKPRNNKNWQSIGVDTLLLIIINLDDMLFTSHFSLLEQYFTLWKEKFIKNNEFSFPPNSTWMDTLERKTAVEIESLYLKILKKFANKKKSYTQEVQYRKQKLIERIRNSKGDINLVLSFLFLEDLFTLKEWEKYFDELIKENFLEWGGFSSISKNNPDFKNEDYGELSLSYHYGDSWYFLNNLAAFALEKINHIKYKKIINSIIKASLNDLFIDGALGFCSEISNAKDRKSQGSLVQLWSITSLIYFFLKYEYRLQIFEQLP